MIFTVPWRCMLIILLLTFLQSLAQQESWAGALAMQTVTPVVVLPLESSQRGFGLPRPFLGCPFPSHCVCWWFLSALCAAVNMGHPCTSRWHSQVCCKQSWIKLPVAGMMLSAHKCHSQQDTQRHRGSPCTQKYKNNNLCSNHWIPIPLPPSSSSSHPCCSQKLSSGTSRVFPWHSLYSQVFKTLSVFPAMWHTGFWTAEFDDSRRSNVLKL